MSSAHRKKYSGRNVTSTFVLPCHLCFTNDYHINIKNLGASGSGGGWEDRVYISKINITCYKHICLTIEILNHSSHNFS